MEGWYVDGLTLMANELWESCVQMRQEKLNEEEYPLMHMITRELQTETDTFFLTSLFSLVVLSELLVQEKDCKGE